jgi:hypothetical protein
VKTYVTPDEAAILADRNVRTIRRWMTGRLLATYRRGDGKLVVNRLELLAVERAQRTARKSPRARLRQDYVEALADLTERASASSA